MADHHSQEPYASCLHTLRDKRVVVTRPRGQAEELVTLLEACGATPLVFSAIEIVPPPRWSVVDRAISRLRHYDTVIFTSVNGVRFFCGRLNTQGVRLEALNRLTVCAIGSRTAAELETRGVRVDLVPQKFQAESVVEALRHYGIAGKRVLLPRAEKAREVLPEEIRKNGGQVDVVPVYRTVRGKADRAALTKLLTTHAVDAVTFTSSSTVEHFVELIGGNVELLKGCVVACLGPITAATAASFGIAADVMPEEFTARGLVHALAQYFTKLPESIA